MSKYSGCWINLALGLLVAAGVALFALPMAAAIGGVAVGVAPESSFNLVKPIICPGQAALQFYAVERSFHEPGESEPHLECVTAAGDRQDVLIFGILAVVALIYLLVFGGSFLLAFIPLALLAAFVRRRVQAARRP